MMLPQVMQVTRVFRGEEKMRYARIVRGQASHCEIDGQTCHRFQNNDTESIHVDLGGELPSKLILWRLHTRARVRVSARRSIDRGCRVS